MALVPIHNIGAAGIITDIPAYELPPEAWTAGENVRFHNGRVSKILGHQAVFGTPTVAPLWITPMYTPNQAYWVYGGLQKVYVTNMLNHYNITRQTTGVDVNYSAMLDTKWNGGSLNGIGIFNNGIDDPQMWNPPETSQKLVVLSNWPANTKAAVIRPAFQYFLIALNITEAGTNYPQVLRWSHPAAPGAVPSSWDYTDATKDAGRTPLADTPGNLLDFAMLGRIGFIYKEDSVYTMQFVGGRNIFKIDPLYTDVGLFARDCVKAFRGKHFVVTTDDIIIHSGGAYTSLLTERQRIALFERIDTTYRSRSFVMPNYSKNEMWFCYPEAGQILPTRALVWNWDRNTLGDRQLGGQISFATFGVVTSNVTDNTWNSDFGTWDSDSSIWDQRSYDPGITSVVAARYDSPAFLQLERGSSFNGAAITAYVERQGLALVGQDRQGNPKVDRDVLKFVKRVVPNIQGGPVEIMLGSHTTPDGAITWQGPKLFNPATDREVTFDVVGPYIAIRFQSTGITPWELVSYALDIELIGRY